MSQGLLSVNFKPLNSLVRDQGVLLHDMRWLIKCLKSKDLKDAVDAHQVGALSDGDWLNSITFSCWTLANSLRVSFHTPVTFSSSTYPVFVNITSAGKQILQWL